MFASGASRRSPVRKRFRLRARKGVGVRASDPRAAARRARTVRSERSAIHPTRLETRTKESSGRASQWVSNKPKGALKEKKIITLPRLCEAKIRRSTGGPPPLCRWRSLSTHAGTRKMVNYAWAGRSQGKLWWRSVAVLTCKSIVGPGYRGERLIEPSGSWFPPKFPSG